MTNEKLQQALAELQEDGERMEFDLDEWIKEPLIASIEISREEIEASKLDKNTFIKKALKRFRDSFLLVSCLLLTSCSPSSNGFSVIYVCQKDSYSKAGYCQICLKDELKNKCYPFGTSEDGLLFAIDLDKSIKESIEDSHYVYAKGVELK